MNKAYTKSLMETIFRSRKILVIWTSCKLNFFWAREWKLSSFAAARYSHIWRKI